MKETVKKVAGCITMSVGSFQSEDQWQVNRPSNQGSITSACLSQGGLLVKTGQEGRPLSASLPCGPWLWGISSYCLSGSSGHSLLSDAHPPYLGVSVFAPLGPNHFSSTSSSQLTSSLDLQSVSGSPRAPIHPPDCQPGYKNSPGSYRHGIVS